MIAKRGLAVLAGWYAAILGVLFLFWIRLPSVKADDTCDGIGFGCTPSARDGATILAVVYGIPMLSASLLIALVALALAVVGGVRSAGLAGTLAALVGLAAPIALLAGYLN